MVCSPKDVITMSAMAEISNSLQARSPKAVIRMGDYPRRDKEVSVSIVLSTVIASDRVENLFVRAEDLVKRKKALEVETDDRLQKLYDLGSKIPILE